MIFLYAIVKILEKIQLKRYGVYFKISAIIKYLLLIFIAISYKVTIEKKLMASFLNVEYSFSL